MFSIKKQDYKNNFVTVAEVGYGLSHYKAHYFNISESENK
jgi:hypothetical protein